MQPLSEAWATAYVQILITLIIFALGIPALAIQLVVQDDIRTVFQRRWKWTMWSILVLIILAAFFAFVWILHPPFNKSAKDSAPNNVPMSIASDRDDAPHFTAAPNPSTTVTPESVDPVADIASPVAAILMTIIPVGLLSMGFMYTFYLRRQHIIKSLEADLMEDFVEHSRLQRVLRVFNYVRYLVIKKKKTRKRKSRRKASTSARQNPIGRRLDKDALYDLIYLGVNGKPGKDKSLVLHSLDRIASLVQNPETYQGDELEELIRGLKEILLSGEQGGNDENFTQAIEILKNVRYRLSQKPDTSKYIDAGLANLVLEELGIEAIKRRSRQIAERFLEEASSSNRTVFTMGLIALKNSQFHTAILALNKLETLAEDKSLAACSATSDLLGLLAHFMFSGPASRMRADSFLSANISDFSPSIDRCLVEAYGHHYESGHFDTADVVFQLRNMITTKQWSPLLFPT